jgi:hypothetical protein
MENQMTREAALAEIASIEREIARLQAEPAEEQRRIAMATASARAGGGGFITPPNQPPDFTSEELAPAALRYGVPLAVGMAAGPVVGLGALLRRPDLALSALARSGLMTGGAAALGEGGAQTVEKVTKEEDYRPEQIFGAGLRGMSPMLKKAPFINTAIAAGSGVAGGAAEGKTGGEEMFWEGVKSAGPTAILQGLGAALGAGREMLSKGIRNTQDIERIAPGKIRATFSQAFPEYAGLESRVASQTGSQDLNQQLIEQSRVVANAVQRITGIPAEAHSDLVSRVAQTFGGLSPETGARLANEAQGVNDAFFAVERARSEAQKSIAQDALAEAQQSFQKAVEMETLKGGIRGGGVRPYQSAVMGNKIEGVLGNTKKAFSNHADILYTPVKQFENDPVFVLTGRAGPTDPSVEQEVLNLMDKYPVLSTGEQSRAFTPYFKKLQEIIDGKIPASLNQLRAIRDQLYDVSDVAGQAFGTSAKRDIRGVANRITQTIDYQAPSFLGQANADSLKTANSFYSEFRPRFDEFGVVQAFKPGTMETGQMADLYAGRVARQGTATPAFENASSLLEDLAKAKVQNVPSSSNLIDITRSGILDRSIDPVTNQLDLKKLAGDLNYIEQQKPGGLAKLGFGTKSELNRFVQYMENLDPAKAKGPEVVLDLLKSGTPAGFAVASRAVQMLPDLATVDSVLKSLEKQAVKGSKAAGETLLNIRAREIENILLEAGKTGPKPNLGSLIELTNPEMRQKVQLILGPKLLKTIDDIFVPGFRVMETAREAAGMAGSTVRGAAIERIGKAALEAPVQIASGEVVKPAVNVFSKMADAVGFAVMSKVLSKGAGVSGLRDRKQFYGLLKQIAEKPQAQQIQLLRRYVGEDRSE